MKGMTAFIMTLLLLIESLPLVHVPALEVDAAERLKPVSTRATGHLYGLAEEGVPSKAMTDSIDISSVSQKVVDGLQHPTGDVSHVAAQLENCDYTVVYLQDSYSTWYYCHNEIMEMRKNGTYDWKEYLTESYFPIVKEKVEKLKTASYKDSLVYCIFNECDNAIWFGNYVDGNVHFDDIGKQNFYQAWKMTYDYVRSLDEDAVIGGPGYFDYDTTKIMGFMTYCAENNCVPDIMIYHELAWWSLFDWQKHVDDYRRIEAELGITEPLPIVVTEYGEMQDCGNPGKMIHYITQIEKSETWGQMAYWRLANNLNDTAADDNSPNSNWWLFRKYAEMEGTLLGTRVKSLREKDLYDTDWRATYKGIASLNCAENEIKVIAAGSDNKRAVKIKNLDTTSLGKKVNVKVECVYYKGLSGIVSAPIVLRQYDTSVSCGKLNINIPGTDTDAVYFITVSDSDGKSEAVRNTNIPVRYEFEEGKLLGNSYVYDSAYATTGEEKGMVGGNENEGDGVRIKIFAGRSGTYNFDVIFGKANDGSEKNDRDFAKAVFSLDGREETVSFKNTIKSEYTDCYTMELELCAGIHTVEFRHLEGTFVLDSALLYLKEESNEISLLPDGDKAYLAVAPYDGYYDVSISKTVEADIDSARATLSEVSKVYLRRGLNEITLSENAELVLLKSADSVDTLTVKAEDMTLSDGAHLTTDKYGNTYADGISSEGGKACFKVNASEAGSYRITLDYANNREGGYHDYNVDLIETMLTYTVNGESKNVFTRNTYSIYNYKTMTFDVSLTEGENEIELSNSGEILFNNQESFAPQIKSLTVNKVTK